MNFTNDQYVGLHQLEKWYRKYSHQIIEISGVVGTGSWQLLQRFLEDMQFDPREIMYLSYDQKQVIELGVHKYHIYDLNSIIYHYNRIVDLNSLYVFNSHTDHMEYHWEKKIRKKVDKRYKLIVVFDGILLDKQTLRDLCTFQLPIILLTDPMLLPSPHSYIYTHEPNIVLQEAQPELFMNPINYFAQKVLLGSKLKQGNYDCVSVISRKQLNLYNLKVSGMNLCLSNPSMQMLNQMYRSKILHCSNTVNRLHERLILLSDHYDQKLVNHTEKRIRIYLRKGLVGTITKLNKHVPNTKYVPMEFQPDFYHESFQELVMDHQYLNQIQTPTRQLIPDEVCKFQYAYALTPELARLSHWEKVTLLMDEYNDQDPEYRKRALYTAITRARNQLTIVL